MRSPLRIQALFVLITMKSKQHVSLGMVVKNSGTRRVAIVGGGIAGLSCAKAITTSQSSQPLEVTVFDTGRLRPGGRCSSRLPGDMTAERTKPSNRAISSAIVDHAAQILTVPQGFSAFQKQVEEWEQQGVLTRFPESSVAEIRGSKTKPGPILAPVNKSNDRIMYYGTNGMGSIAASMTKGLSIEQDIWVSPSYGARYVNGKWKLVADGKPLGEFDQLVIAHNGKCADRLLSKSPAKTLHSLLRVNFGPSVPSWGGSKMTLNSIYSLAFCIPKSSPLSTVFPFISGFIRNDPDLSFLSCNSRKYPKKEDGDNETEIWTLLSSSKFAKQHKAPQEFLPDEVVSEVTGLMLTALERSLSLPNCALYDGPEGVNRILESRLQLWGAGVPVNVWETDRGFCHDSQYQVAACGDWLLHPSIAGAWESGYRLGKFIVSEESKYVSVGLPPDGAFRPAALSRACIGSL